MVTAGLLQIAILAHRDLPGKKTILALRRVRFDAEHPGRLPLTRVM
jgi:hypothetical protein